MSREATPAAAKPATARPAATVMLLRDGPKGMEVFMVVRHHQIDFASGALVFPGGSVDAADRSPLLRRHCPRCETLSDAELGFRVAAVREAFEECGVLLARPAGSDRLVEAARLADLEAAYRQPLEKGEVTMVEMAERERLDIATDLLVPFAHWITPETMPKRFDTHFFLVEAPGDHVALHDGRESVDSVWITPADACAEADEGRRTVIFPTRVNLEKLGRNTSTAAALEAARRAEIVTVLPQVQRTSQGRIMRIPAEADYGFTEVHIAGGSNESARRI